MVSKTWRSRAQRTPTLGKVLAFSLVWLIAWSTPVLAEDAGDAPVVTEVPPPTEAPPPPTEAPPPPTEAPLPTEVPAPTEEPVSPTEEPVDPTEVPVDPTEEPVDPTEVPTETPTPTPTPTAEPAIPFAPAVTCNLIEAGALPVAGESNWSFQDCTATWETENVSAVELHAWSDAAGWQVIAVNANALGNQEVLDASNGLLNLSDSNLEDEGFASSRFYIGTQLGCTSPTSALVNLDLTSTSTAPVPEDEDGNPLSNEPGETVIEIAQLRDLTLDGQSPSAPVITIAAATFTPIDLMEGVMTSTGTVEVHFSDAPKACSWQLTLTFGDLANGDVVIPIGGLQLVDVVGIDAASVSLENGSFSIVQPGGVEGASGAFAITTFLELSESVPAGEYATSLTVSTLVTP